jgi:hypothetical protein
MPDFMAMYASHQGMVTIGTGTKLLQQMHFPDPRRRFEASLRNPLTWVLAFRNANAKTLNFESLNFELLKSSP